MNQIEDEYSYIYGGWSGEDLQQGRVSESDNCSPELLIRLVSFIFGTNPKNIKVHDFPSRFPRAFTQCLLQAEIKSQTRHCGKQSNEKIVSLQITCSKEGVPPRQEGARVPQGIVPTVGGSRFYSVNKLTILTTFILEANEKEKDRSRILQPSRYCELYSLLTDSYRTKTTILRAS